MHEVLVAAPRGRPCGGNQCIISYHLLLCRDFRKCVCGGGGGGVRVTVKYFFSLFMKFGGPPKGGVLTPRTPPPLDPPLTVCSSWVAFAGDCTKGPVWPREVPPFFHVVYWSRISIQWPLYHSMHTKILGSKLVQTLCKNYCTNVDITVLHKYFGTTNVLSRKQM